MSEEIDKVSRYLIEISRQTDPKKINNIASDVKKAWQELKMCKEQSFIFNERRRLFNMPMNTFNQHINSIEHQLEIYKILWCTASGNNINNTMNALKLLPAILIYLKK